MDPFEPLGCTLALYEPCGGPGWPPAAFSSQMRVFHGLELFSEEMTACGARYVSENEKVHTPRFRQILFLRAWHSSRTSLRRIVGTALNNLSNLTAILALLRGGTSHPAGRGGFKSGFLQIKCAGLTGKVIFCTKSIETTLRHYLVTMVTMFLVSHTSNPGGGMALRQA